MSRLAILAMGKSIDKYPGRGGSKFHKEYDEVWALNGMAFWPGCDDIDRLYVMDDLVYRLPHYCNSELAESLKTYEKRIITSKAYKDWPTAEAFPIDDCVAEFGLPLAIVMYSTPDWMIAHAIMEKWDEIDIFGVDNHDKAKEEMRSSTALWIGIAMSKGITVSTFAGSYHQFFTSTAVALEFGIYGYAFRPRIEKLMFPVNDFIEATDGSDSDRTNPQQRAEKSSP